LFGHSCPKNEIKQKKRIIIKKEKWKTETETIYNKYGMGKTFGMTENWGRLSAPNRQFVYSI